MNTSSIFFEEIFQEAMMLIEETRHYIQAHAEEDVQRVSPGEGLYYSCEISRITARLTEIMSWLLTQKALVSGEISLEDDPFYPSLQKDSVCLHDSAREDRIKTPLSLKWLLEKSLSLYKRVIHLADLEMKIPQKREKDYSNPKS
ncbi:MAG: DUF1465 family protein [bacterium]|nr:DUF1465 family protein [bacterium]